MGACYNSMTLDGKLTKEQVKEKFSDRQDQDGYDCGRGGYSGTFYEARGLSFTDREFDTADAADEYLQNHAQKWEAALAVRHKDYEIPKSATKHMLALNKLRQQIYNAETKLRNAQQKAFLNNRSVKPAYVIKAEENLETVKGRIQPKIDERTAKVATIISKAASKSKKWVWLIGAVCSY